MADTFTFSRAEKGIDGAKYCPRGKASVKALDGFPHQNLRFEIQLNGRAQLCLLPALRHTAKRPGLFHVLAGQGGCAAACPGVCPTAVRIQCCLFAGEDVARSAVTGPAAVPGPAFPCAVCSVIFFKDN